MRMVFPFADSMPISRQGRVLAVTPADAGAQHTRIVAQQFNDCSVGPVGVASRRGRQHNTDLEWLIDRYRVVQDNESGIVNDPDGWFKQPEDLITATAASFT